MYLARWLGLTLGQTSLSVMDIDLSDSCLDTVAFGFADSCVAADFPFVEYEWIFWLSAVTAAAFVALAIPRLLYLS